jgi:hypothetical protein
VPTLSNSREWYDSGPAAMADRRPSTNPLRGVPGRWARFRIQIEEAIVAMASTPVLAGTSTSILVTTGRLLYPPGAAEVGTNRRPDFARPVELSGARRASSSHASALLVDRSGSRTAVRQSAAFPTAPVRIGHSQVAPAARELTATS